MGTLKDYRTERDIFLFLDTMRIISYSAGERNINTRNETMIETITTTIDAAGLVFGTFAYIWAGMAAFAGVMYVSVSR